METKTQDDEKISLEARVEMLKKSFDEASDKSKEVIRDVLRTCNDQAKVAVETNQQIIDTAIKQLETYKIDTSYFRSLQDTIGKSVELSEEVVDSIITSHNKRVNLTVEFNKKCLEVLKDMSLSKAGNFERLLPILQNNFNESIQLSINNMKGIINMYNKHLNLSVNFSKNFFDSIDKQVDVMSEFYQKRAGMFTDWVSNWWENVAESKK